MELTGKSERRKKEEGEKRERIKYVKTNKRSRKMLDGYPCVNVNVIVSVSVDAGQGRQVGERDDKGDVMG